MATTYPIATADLVDLLLVETATFALEDNQEVSGTGGGELIAADLGPPLWSAEVSTVAADIETIEQLRARFLLLGGAVGSFLLYDPRRPNVATDPTGALLAAATLTIHAIGADRDEITIAGLPIGFVVPDGAFLSVTAGSPARTYFGQIAMGATANGDGRAGPMPLRPHLRPWIATGQAVKLNTPVMKVKLLPRSLSVAQVTSVTHRLRFTARQTLASG